MQKFSKTKIPEISPKEYGSTSPTAVFCQGTICDGDSRATLKYKSVGTTRRYRNHTDCTIAHFDRRRCNIQPSTESQRPNRNMSDQNLSVWQRQNRICLCNWSVRIKLCRSLPNAKPIETPTERSLDDKDDLLRLRWIWSGRGLESCGECF